jgi:hypothetical protein
LVGCTAYRRLQLISAKQAKEYQELFPPTCSKNDPAPIAISDLNTAIMIALSEKRADDTSAIQVPQKVNEGEVYVSTLDTRNGIVAKNPLGIRGVDAVQVSSHRGPPTDRPPDHAYVKESLGGVCRRGQAPVILASWLSSHAWATV